MAASRVVRPSRHPTSASQKVVRPTANPMKPGTPAAVDSQDSTFAPSEDDAADAGAAAAPCRSDHGRAVLRAIEALDLPDVGLYPCILELVDRVDHVARPARPVVRVLVAVELFQLRALRGHEELEHELSPRPVEVLGQVAQARRLAAVHLRVALGVVAHEDLAEGGRERLDVACVVVAVLEVELVLPALLRRRGGEKATRPRVAEDRGAELFVDEDSGARLRHATSDRGEEALVDDRLRRRDPRRLLGGERPLPAEETRLERPAVVEGEDVERSVEPEVGHDASMCRRRWRRMSAFVELSWRSGGSVLLSSSGMMRCASCFPSSTPHWSNESMCQITPCVNTLCS